MLASTNSHLRNAVNQYHFSLLQKIIATFHLPPITLLKILFATQSVISGSIALWLLKPYSFAPNDIDIYVPKHKSPQITEFIEAKSIYTLPNHGIFAIPSAENYALNKSIRMVLCMETKRSNKTINIIVSKKSTHFLPYYIFIQLSWWSSYHHLA